MHLPSAGLLIAACSPEPRLKDSLMFTNSSYSHELSDEQADTAYALLEDIQDMAPDVLERMKASKSLVEDAHKQVRSNEASGRDKYSTEAFLEGVDQLDQVAEMHIDQDNVFGWETCADDTSCLVVFDYCGDVYDSNTCRQSDWHHVDLSANTRTDLSIQVPIHIPTGEEYIESVDEDWCSGVSRLGRSTLSAAGFDSSKAYKEGLKADLSLAELAFVDPVGWFQYHLVEECRSRNGYIMTQTLEDVAEEQ